MANIRTAYSATATATATVIVVVIPVGGAAAVHDATVDGELELVARLVAAVAMLARPLTDAELDEILLP